MAIRYWLCPLPRERVMTLVARGVLALGQEYRDVIAEPRQADGIVCYSARERPGQEERIQEFTALGYVADDAVLRVGNAWQRSINWDRTATPIGLRPIARSLAGTIDMYAWGRSLRRGLVELSRDDFATLKNQMRPDPPGAWPIR